MQIITHLNSLSILLDELESLKHTFDGFGEILEIAKRKNAPILDDKWKYEEANRLQAHLKRNEKNS